MNNRGLSVKADIRAKRVLSVLLQHGNASVAELVELLKISPASVRRDLVQLESRGLVHRTHGGATLLPETTYEPFRFDSSFHVRQERFQDEKRRIAAAAAQLVRDRQTIGLTSGTTTTQLAHNLRHIQHLHVITNAVNIGMELSTYPALRVTLTGGSVRWPGAFSMVGPNAIASIENTFFDTVFMGVCGIDPEHGATAIEDEEALLFRVMASHAKQVVVLADSSKIGMVSPARICKLAQIHQLITDTGISAAHSEAFREAGLEVLTV